MTLEEKRAEMGMAIREYVKSPGYHVLQKKYSESTRRQRQFDSQNKYKKTNSGIASNRNYQWRKAGIDMTQEKYLVLVEACDNQCPLCTPEENVVRITKGECLYVDHCHKTEEIRGLLCKQHNLHLAYFDTCLPKLLKYMKYK